MRTFIAVDLPPGIKTEIGRTIEELMSAEADVRWVKHENIHLTIRFLGEIEENTVERIKAVIRSAAGKIRPFTCRLRGIGCFPQSGNPKVLWVGCAEGEEGLIGIFEAVSEGLWSIGIERESRPFAVHATIGRVKKPNNLKKLKELMAKYRTVEFDPFMVSDVVLYKSTLTPDGPIYEVLEKFPLGK